MCLILSTRVEWGVKQVGPGIKTQVPVVVKSSRDDALKSKIAEYPFQVTLPIKLRHSGANLALQPGAPELKGGTKYVYANDAKLMIVGVDVGSEIGQFLNKSIDINALLQNCHPKSKTWNPNSNVHTSRARVKTLLLQSITQPLSRRMHPENFGTLL